MRGFVARPGGGFLEEMQRLEQATHLLRSDFKGINCFKFGAKVIPLHGTPCYANVLRPNFFALPKDEDKTKIETVIEHSHEGGLMIVVTDLFEDEANLGELYEVFKNFVFTSNLDLGIVAFRRGFDGVIYDIGPEHGHETWSHERPFYALVIGRSGDVADYLNELVSLGVKADRLLILSQELLQMPISWETSKPIKSSNISLDPSIVEVTSGPRNFGVVRLHGGSCSLDLQLNAKSAPYRPIIDWGKIVAEPRVRRLSRDFSNAVVVDVKSMGLDRRIIPDPSGEHPLLEFRWIPDNIHPPGNLYIEQVLFRVDRDAINFGNAKFVEEWSQTPAPGQPEKFDGGKTQYLSEFIVGLWRSILRISPSDLGSIYIYFQP